MKQLNFDIVAALHVQRGGLVGIVQAYIEAHPWEECGEIAKAINAPSLRVSNCLNRLKLEGNAQQIKNAGRSNKSLWAGTSEAGREKRDAYLTGVLITRDENEQAKTIRAFRDAMRSGNNYVASEARGIGLSGLFKNETMEA
jgi:phosphosulfolactate synthase (CoM biosynthesis protein A)